MRLWHLAIAAALIPNAATGSQRYFFSSASSSSSPSTALTTLVDALNADPDYSSLLLLLQRARLIPTLNRLKHVTLFAPTNDAIARHNSSLWNSALSDDYFLRDNVHEELRQQLFYHLINSSVSSLPEEPEKVMVLKTLHYPRTPLEPPSKEPPPYPPWMPIPGGTLGSKPQRLRVAANGQKAYVGVDSFGHGGAEIVKGKVDVGNGVLLGISDVLVPPPALDTVVSEHTSLSYFNLVLTPEISTLLNSTNNLTLFLPVNDAWESLDPYERLYLESGYATDDLNRIFNLHAVVKNRVQWSDTFDPAVNLTTVDGTTLEIVVAPEKTMVSTATLLQPDIYAANGVLHLISDLLLPDGALQLTPEKYLLGLNCSSFVSLLHDADLAGLVNDTSAKYTILAPRDDVLSVLGDEGLPEPGTEAMRKLLQYHFLPGRWTPKKLEDGMLLETALVEQGLDGGKQVLSIEVSSDEIREHGKNTKSIRFADAATIGDCIEVNNTVIYFLSRPLIPPSDTLDTVLPSLELSSFLAAILSTSVAETLRTTPRTTLLMPHNSAFTRLGLLVSAHLLAATSKKDLEQVLLHHALDGVEYTRSIQNGSQHTFPTLEGTDVHIERNNGTALISASGGWAGMKAELYPRNMLTETGVIHELSDILIPRTVKLNVGKLVKAAKGSTMATMLSKAGMEWVLNGTAPPEDSPWSEAGLEGMSWTLLCPTDDAFKEYNLTALYEDVNQLKVIVGQHLIPTPPTSNRPEENVLDNDPLNNNRPLAMNDQVTYTTLRSSSSAYGDIVFRQRTSEDGQKQYVVGIKGARGTDGKADWATVLSWGRSTTGGGTGGVIQIDRMLVPYQPPWWIEYGAPIVVGVLGGIAICIFFYGVNIFWRRDTTEATYEPIGGFGRDDDDESG